MELVRVRQMDRDERDLLLAFNSGLYAQVDLKQVKIKELLEAIRDPGKQDRERRARERQIKEARRRMARNG